MKGITRKQDILDFVVDYTKEKGFAPTIREICEATGLKSTACVHRYLKELRSDGLITWEPGKNRTLIV